MRQFSVSAALIQPRTGFSKFGHYFFHLFIRLLSRCAAQLAHRGTVMRVHNAKAVEIERKTFTQGAVAVG